MWWPTSHLAGCIWIVCSQKHSGAAVSSLFVVMLCLLPEPLWWGGSAHLYTITVGKVSVLIFKFSDTFSDNYNIANCQDVEMCNVIKCVALGACSTKSTCFCILTWSFLNTCRIWSHNSLVFSYSQYETSLCLTAFVSVSSDRAGSQTGHAPNNLSRACPVCERTAGEHLAPLWPLRDI